MIDSIEIDFIWTDLAAAPSLDKLEQLGEQTDRYVTSMSPMDVVSFWDETNNPSVGADLDTHEADADWFTLPSLPAVSMDIATSDFEQSPNLEATTRNLTDQVEYIYLSVDGYQYAYGLDVEHQHKLASDREPGIPVSQESLADNRIEAVSWLMVFSPGLVEEYGREWLLSAPAWERRELDDGGIMLVTNPDPTDWNEAAAACQDLANYFDLSR
jgi:hypothetical protein